MTCVTCQMFVNTKQMKWLNKHTHTHEKLTQINNNNRLKKTTTNTLHMMKYAK